MNHYVPDFEMDEDYSIPTSSALTRPKKSSAMAEEGIMELLWQNGPVVVQSQTQRAAGKKSYMAADTVMLGAEPPFSVREMRSDKEAPPPLPPPPPPLPPPPPPQLFMQEDEMASWLHYPLDDATFDRDFYADLFYPPATCAPPVAVTTAPPSRTNVQSTEILTPRPPSIPLPRRAEVEAGSSRFQNFMHFSRAARDRMDSCGPSSSSRGMKESSTVVDSNETPAAALGLESRGVSISNAVDSNTAQIPIGANFCFSTLSCTAGAATLTSTSGCELATTCELTVTSSSPGVSGASASVEPQQKQQGTSAAAADERKRKGRETDDAAEYNSEDVDFESLEARKQVRGSTAAKRSRAAEVHNLSERRRRDRINEKMRALQELIPRCNKSDKASMLDEAIEYLKSLQLQVQMMSIGCSMVPMIYPGVQQYMPPMGVGMGMGMGMEMGMNRPMVPFPPVLPVTNPAAAAHLGPRFPMPSFHMQPVPVPDPSRMQTTGQSQPMLINSNQPRLPNFTDPYQQHIGLQLPPHQNQVIQPSSSKPSSNR